MSTIQKTVFFLGAGFSKEAGGPIQNELITTILSDEFKDHINDDSSGVTALNKFKKFIKDEMCFEDSHYKNIALEDVFTPIDRCIADGRTLGTYSNKELVDFRENLHYLLAKAIQFRVDYNKTGNSKYIEDFAEYINSIAKRRMKHFYEDNIAVLTTNWDIILDNQLNKIARRETDLICNGDKYNGPIAVVDYCCYISSLEADMNIKPGLFALGRKGYNIKYLKLHGSMNWLHCPCCQRLYVKFDEKTMFAKKHCKHCAKNFSLRNDCSSIQLRGNLLLPTFIKDLRNIQLQLIWQNAGIELSEATKVVFIGYSLPAADFEIRQLLSRFIRKNAQIEVVIYPGHNAAAEEQRYKNFFGDRQITVKRMTVPDYISNITDKIL